MEYIFNELSVFNCIDNIAAKDSITNFVITSLSMQRLGFKILRLDETIGNNLFNLALTEEYRISDWLRDNSIEKELKDSFRTIVTNSPLLMENESREVTLFDNSEFNIFINGRKKRALGLGVAYIKNTWSISLSHNTFWNNSTVPLNWEVIENNDLQTKKVIVQNIFNTTYLQDCKKWYEDKLKETLETGEQFWKSRETVFPNLIFCNGVERQLKNLGTSKYLSQIIDRLKNLNDYASYWETDNFNVTKVNQATNLNISSESETTMSKFGGERSFKLPDKRYVYHELHIKTGDLRLHFYPDNDNKKIYIGYIGRHLNISSSG